MDKMKLMAWAAVIITLMVVSGAIIYEFQNISQRCRNYFDVKYNNCVCENEKAQLVHPIYNIDWQSVSPNGTKDIS